MRILNGSRNAMPSETCASAIRCSFCLNQIANSSAVQEQSYIEINGIREIELYANSVRSADNLYNLKRHANITGLKTGSSQKRSSWLHRFLHLAH